MKTHERSGEDFLSPNSSQIANSEKYNSTFLGIVDHAHSVNILHLISASFQIFLGLSAILLSIAGFIKPIWMSVILSMVASVATMVGIYFLYTVISGSRGADQLLHDAMRRIMDAKN